MRRLKRAGRSARARAVFALAMLLGVALTVAGCYVEAPYPAPPPGPPPPVVYVPGQWVWNGVGWVWRPPYWTAVPYAAPPAGAHPAPPPPGGGQPPPQSQPPAVSPPPPAHQP